MKKEQIIILLISFFLGMLILNVVKNVCGCELKEGFNSYVGGKSPPAIANNALTCGARIASRCGRRIAPPQEYECAEGDSFFVLQSDDPDTRCNRDLEYIQNKFGPGGLTACREYDLNSWITEVCGPQFVIEPGENEQVVTEDPCNSSPCQNGGACLVNADGHGYTCQCVDGFEGVNCETNINECANNPCQNGGTCNDGVNEYTCQCQAGYSGENCGTDICVQNPCQNNGICNRGSEDGNPTRTCDCSGTGFTGPNCETDLCDGVTCSGHGTCDGGTCQCVDGYSGTNCEIDLCAGHDCQNLGICNAGVCECPGGTYLDRLDGENPGVCNLCTPIPGVNPNIILTPQFDNQENLIQVPDNVNGMDISTSDSSRSTALYMCSDASTTAFNPDSNILKIHPSTNICSDGGTGTWYTMNDDKTDCILGAEALTCHLLCGGANDDNYLNALTSNCNYDSDPPEGAQITRDNCNDPCNYPTPYCNNGGSCSVIEGGYTCDCSDTGFEGDTCQDQTDLCASINCGAHGSCNDGRCQCEAGYSGDRCQDHNPCHDVVCTHGRCNVGTGRCMCTRGYTGAQCDSYDACNDYCYDEAAGDYNGCYNYCHGVCISGCPSSHPATQERCISYCMTDPMR
tara:strand:+ start:401 stop:2284 length:1884 start_codon:yes stop_codon:yes gene_type:complete